VRAFRIAYDGRPFHGFQRQPDVPTVEDAILDALVGLDLLESSTGPTRPTPPGYAASGRTDAGVSALAQTVAFEAPAWLDPTALNGRLPDAVRAWAVADVPADFHATHDPTRRAYRYHLHAPDADPERARTAAEALSGTHDFHNLTPDETGTERTVSCSVALGGDDAIAPAEFLTLDVSAGGFPRELVRRLATVVRGVATGELSLARVERLLGPEPVDGPEGVPPAPPEPLILTAVEYPGVTFERDADAAAETREVFATRRRRGLVAARTFETILDGVSVTHE
jgi:tRNA pseudouridine38-40 synthase